MRKDYSKNIIEIPCPYCGGVLIKGRFYEASNFKFLPYKCTECYRKLGYGEIF